MMARAVQERTAAGIKHLRRLQARRVRGAQAKRLSSPARCCLQGVRTRHGISRIHHRCFGSVAASLESRASRLQVSRNCADQEHLDRDLPEKWLLAWKVPWKSAGPSGKMASGMEGPGGKRKETLGNRRNFRGKEEVKEGVKAEVKAGMGLLPEMEEKLIGEGRDGGNWAAVVKNGIGTFPYLVRRGPVSFHGPEHAGFQRSRYRDNPVENGIKRSFVGGDGAFHHHERNRPVSAPRCMGTGLPPGKKIPQHSGIDNFFEGRTGIGIRKNNGSERSPKRIPRPGARRDRTCTAPWCGCRNHRPERHETPGRHRQPICRCRFRL